MNNEEIRREFERTAVRDTRRQPPKGNNYIDPMAQMDWIAFQKGWLQSRGAMGSERDQLAQAIADAACKLGITSEGVALTGPHLLMLLGDMVGMVEGLQMQNAQFEDLLIHSRTAMHNMAPGFYIVAEIDAALAQYAPAADEQGVG